MKKLLLLLFLLPFALQAQQVKTIQGRLMDGDKPLSKTSFYVKDRNMYGKTDKKGNFTLKNVTDNDIIIVGRKNENYREFKVSGFETLSTSNAPEASPQIENKADTVGVKFVPLQSGNVNYAGLNNIASIKQNKSERYIIKETKDIARYSGHDIQFTTFVEANTVGRLPKLQSQYAQSPSGSLIDGLPSEIFSWGEPVNGTAYDAADFFRTGISFGNMLDVKFPNIKRCGLVSVELGQRKSNSPIPNAYSDSYNASFAVSDVTIGRFSSAAGVMYKHSTDNLMQQGANLFSLLYSVLSTPPSFDNAADKTQSYAPDYVQNPFWLAENLPDNRKNDNLTLYARTKYAYRKIEVNTGASFDKNWQKRKDGLLLFPSNHFTDRNENETNAIATAQISYKLINKGSTELKFTPLSYGFKRTENEVQRSDASQNYIRTATILTRNAQDLKYSLYYKYEDRLYVDLENGHYFSNTLSQLSYTNVFPSVAFRWKMESLLYDMFRLDDDDHKISLQGSLRRSIGEAPLVYNNLAALSTTVKAADFRTYYEYADIFHHNNLNAEIYTKGNIGFRYMYNGYSHRHYRYNRISAEINYFNNKTTDYIAPVLNDEQKFELKNLGEVRNTGYEISVNYKRRNWYDITLNFSQSRSKVTAVYGNEAFVPLAGFSDIATVFAPNEPVGAIYGTTYQRNEYGYIMLDNNGLPIVDKELKKIGDPTPDFVLVLIPTFKLFRSHDILRHFRLSLTMEYSHGGERWNGTRAYLDYLGVSEESGNNRNELTQEKLTNYGAIGVGENYIEKATYFRLANVSLLYNLEMKNKMFNTIMFAASARNLFLISAYKGVEPTSNLFGYTAVTGLDLFNLPSVRSYSFSASFTF